MLTRTSELAIRTLLFLALEGDGQPLSPRRIADPMGCSPSYLAKTVAHLVRAGVLRSVRGSAGGVLLARNPAEISIMSVVEACQGLITAPYCDERGRAGEVCSFHRAMVELHKVVVGTLSKWTLEDLLRCPTNPKGGEHDCRMSFEGCQNYEQGRRSD